MAQKARFGVQGGLAGFTANLVHIQVASLLVIAESGATFDARESHPGTLSVEADSSWVQAFPSNETLFVSGGADPTQIICLWREYDGGIKGAVPVLPTSESVSLIAATTIPGHRAIMTDANGQGILADPNAADYLFFGISISGANIGQSFDVVLDGVVTESTWNWVPRAPLFAAAEGLMTQTPPTSGINQIIATALTPTSILITVQPPILLA